MNRLALRLLGAMLALTLVVLIVVPTLQWFAIRATLQQLPFDFRERLVERTTPQRPLGRWVRPWVDFDLAGSAGVGVGAWTAEEESARLMVLLSDLRATQRRSAAIGHLVSLVLCAWVAVTSARSIAGPSESVSRAASQVASGSLKTRVDLHRFRRPPEEALRLGQNFNAMAEALERSERRRTAMIADVAHDLRTPLAILQLRLEAAADGLVAVDPTEIGRLLGYVTLLTRLTNDLRLLASADAGRLTLHAKPVELRTWLDDALVGYRTAADRSGVTLATRLPGGDLDARVDPDRLQEVVHNVMDNALRHTPAGGPPAAGSRSPSPRPMAASSSTSPTRAPASRPNVSPSPSEAPTRTSAAAAAATAPVTGWAWPWCTRSLPCTERPCSSPTTRTAAPR